MSEEDVRASSAGVCGRVSKVRKEGYWTEGRRPGPPRQTMRVYDMAYDDDEDGDDRYDMDEYGNPIDTEGDVDHMVRALITSGAQAPLDPQFTNPSAEIPCIPWNPSADSGKGGTCFGMSCSDCTTMTCIGFCFTLLATSTAGVCNCCFLCQVQRKLQQMHDVIRVQNALLKGEKPGDLVFKHDYDLKGQPIKTVRS